MWHTPRFPGRILFSPDDRGPTGSRRPSHRRRSADFRLERLEDRTVLSLLVTTGADSGPGSLRDTIASAGSGSVIEFAKDVHTISLTSGEIAFDISLDIEGPGANKLTISGSDNSRIFDIGSDATDVTIAGLTITDGLANKDSPDEPSLGGGILNFGDLTLSEVVVSDCLAIGDASAIRTIMVSSWARLRCWRRCL